MNKEQQIEEMWKDTISQLEKMPNIQLNTVNCDIRVLQALYNAGYRKVYPQKLCNGTDFELTDEDKEQIEEIRTNLWRENTTLSDVCYYIIRKQQEVRKETASEILKDLKKILEKDDYDYYYFEWIGIAKKYGVEGKHYEAPMQD